MTEQQIKEYLATVWHEDEVPVLSQQFGLNVVDELTADLIKQVGATKNQ